MNARHRKTLHAIFTRPTLPSIVFADIESLVIGLGGEVQEREGSRVKILLKGSSGAAIAPIRAKRPSATRLKKPANCWSGQE